MTVTYIGYSNKMIESLIRHEHIDLVSVITKSGVLGDKEKLILNARKIHVYEMNDDSIYKMREHILTDKVLIYKFGYIIPRDIIERHDFYNVHPGCLDNNRGAHPLRWTILLGESRTYMSLYKITGIDEGYLISKEEIEVGDSDYKELDKKMDSKIDITLTHLTAFWDKGRIEDLVLKKSGIYRRKVKEEDYTIDLSKDTFISIQRKIRAVCDFGGAVWYQNGVKYRVNQILAWSDSFGRDYGRNGMSKVVFEKDGRKYAMICDKYSWRDHSD